MGFACRLCDPCMGRLRILLLLLSHVGCWSYNFNNASPASLIPDKRHHTEPSSPTTPVQADARARAMAVPGARPRQLPPLALPPRSVAPAAAAPQGLSSARSPTPDAALARLPLGELAKIARAQGIDQSAIDEAMEAVQPRAAALALLTPRGGKSRSPSPQQPELAQQHPAPGAAAVAAAAPQPKVGATPVPSGWRELQIYCVTWNLMGGLPEGSLAEVLPAGHDVYAVATQETCATAARSVLWSVSAATMATMIRMIRMVVVVVVGGAAVEHPRCRHGGCVGEWVGGSQESACLPVWMTLDRGTQDQSRWLEKLRAHLSECRLVSAKSLGAIHLAVFVRQAVHGLAGAVRSVRSATVRRGRCVFLGGRFDFDLPMCRLFLSRNVETPRPRPGGDRLGQRGGQQGQRGRVPAALR
jgi:hypothetical protein